MFPTPFRHFSPRRQPWFRFQPGNDYGLIEVQMAVSRDGIHWDRPDRRPYFPMGLPDEWDRWLTMMGVGIVRHGNSLYQYYWSTGRTHDSGILRPEYDKLLEPRAAIGAVRQRLDGFISADFAYTGGNLTTPPLVFSGTHLRLNIDTGGMGTAFVEIRDPQGKPMPGFTRGDCEEIGGNFLDTSVRWRGNSDLSALRGRPIVLHVSGAGPSSTPSSFPQVRPLQKECYAPCSPRRYRPRSSPSAWIRWAGPESIYAHGRAPRHQIPRRSSSSFRQTPASAGTPSSRLNASGAAS